MVIDPGFVADARFLAERRAALSRDQHAIGIDWIDVQLDISPPALVLHFVPTRVNVAAKELTLASITSANVAITGGPSATPTSIRITDARPDPDDPMGVRLTFEHVSGQGPSELPSYTLQLVNVPNLDPFFDQITFSLTIARPALVDPLPPRQPPPAPPPGPDIDYLARDYASFRRLMLDRLSTVMPEWTERSPADLGVVLVEVLAYAADQLSYYQDAVATEAYLSTARQRISARRHARLLDYAMHDGCNARVWLQIQVRSATSGSPSTLQVLTGGSPPLTLAPDSADYWQDLAEGAQVFVPLAPFNLYPAHNQISFYTWGARVVSLPQGATSATLRDAGPAGTDPASLARRALRYLRVGDVLLFEEIKGPTTGNPTDADPSRRHAVRLTQVIPTSDPLGGALNDGSGPVPVVQIAWATADALPFSLPIATQMSGGYVEDVCVARGNVVLADHGLLVAAETLPPVPARGRYRPVLQESNLTFAAPNGAAGAAAQPASAALAQDPRAAVAALSLVDSTGAQWTARRDLLSSDRFARDFVVEMDDDGRAHLRFGDGVQGRQPAADLRLTASYRVGNGLAGNVGAGTIRRIVTDDPAIVSATNPLAATGGTAPETVEQVQLDAPQAFHAQERGASADDYVAAARAYPGVQDAAATLRWTGSWYTAFVAVTRQDGPPVDAAFCSQLNAYLQQSRLAGYDLEVTGASDAPLDIALAVQVTGSTSDATVSQQLLAAFSNLDLGGGQQGFFAPGRFGFGQPVYLRQLVAAALEVPDVVRVDATRFQRWGHASQGELQRGWIDIGPLEIARLDNDPTAPQNGVITFNVTGGH